MGNFLGFDIETEGDEEGYALQPWRIKEGSARITLASAWKNDHGIIIENNLTEILDVFREIDHKVVCHNTVFDLAWIYAAGYNIDNIKWFDSMLLCKWLLNGQRAPIKYDLGSMAERFLSGWDRLEEFIKIKEMDVEPGQDNEYWKDRVTLDAEATARIADIVWEQLTPKQKISASIQAMTIPTNLQLRHLGPMVSVLTSRK